MLQRPFLVIHDIFCFKTDYLIPFSKLVATCAYDKKVHPCLPFTIPCIFLRVYVPFVLSGLGAVYIARLLQIPPFSCTHKKSRELPGVWKKNFIIMCLQSSLYLHKSEENVGNFGSCFAQRNEAGSEVKK